MNQNRILIIRSGAIGDVLMTTPLIRGIRKKFPKAFIAYLTGVWSKDVLEDSFNLDQILFFDDNIIFKKKLFTVLKMARNIKKMKFNMCLILDKSYLWNLFAFFCGIPKRYGFSRGWEGFPNTKSVPFDGSKSELDYYLEMGRMLGISIKDKRMELQKDEIFAGGFVKKNGLTGGIIGVGAGGAKNPGQEAPVKRWPKERYISLINRLSGRHHIILFGDGGDKEINKAVLKSAKRSKKKIISATNLTVQQSAALIDKCKYFITSDSGLAHIAATTRTKLIVIFGPTSEKRFAPKNATIIRFDGLECSPCYDTRGNFRKCDDNICMGMIHEGEVLKRIK